MESSAETISNLLLGMTDGSRKCLERLSPLADCTIKTQDGLEVQLAKVFLIEHSGVMGNMIRELGEQTNYSVSDDSQSLSLLLDAICAKGTKQPPITISNVEKILELARKYDVDLRHYCDNVVSEHLAVDPIYEHEDSKRYLKFHLLADQYQLEKTSATCCKFAARNFRSIPGATGNSKWPLQFGVLEQMRIWEARVHFFEDMGCPHCKLHKH